MNFELVKKHAPPQNLHTMTLLVLKDNMKKYLLV